MKKITLLTGLCFAGIYFVSAQNIQNNDGPKLLNKLKITCQLTSQQMAKLQPIVEKHVEALQADKQKLAGTDLKKADDAENTNFYGQLKGALTADQMKAYSDSNKQ